MSDRDTTDRTRGRAKAALAILLGAVLSAAAPPPSARAQDIGAELKRFMYDDATITVHLRSYYLDRTNPSLPNNVGWAGGGWIGYETGWLFDAVRLGIVGYTSLPLVGSADTDGTLLFLPGPKGYAVLGQAYGKLKLFGQEFTGYRQLINQPEVNPQDNRMTPNTFEAYTLAGGFGAFSYFGGYVAKEKMRNSIEFLNMATVAGAPAGVSEGMILAGGTFAPDDTFKARLSAYHVPNILSSGYADAAKLFSLTDDIDLRVSGQFMVQGSTGGHLLTGQAFSTWSGGIDVDLILGPVDAERHLHPDRQCRRLSLTLRIVGRLHHDAAARLQSRQRGCVPDRNEVRPGSRQLPGFALSTNFAFGNGAITAGTGVPLSTNNEYDFTLDYLFANSRLDWPDWLRPLWIRGRIGMLDQFQNGGYSSIRDYRVIANYEVKFGGKGR